MALRVATLLMHEQSKRFFDLPKQLKQSAAGSRSDTDLYRGYQKQGPGKQACEFVCGGFFDHENRLWLPEWLTT